MICIPRTVFYGGFDWYGLRLVVEDTHFRLSAGRIGTYDNPLHIIDGQVRGGWYIPATDITLSTDITRIDILHRESEAFVMFRSSDNAERYPDEFTLLLSLAWKDEDNWYVLTPYRDEEYEKDMH